MVLVLRRTLDECLVELDAFKKRHSHEFPVSNSVQGPSRPSPQLQAPTSPKHDLAATREEIKGLKSSSLSPYDILSKWLNSVVVRHIVQDLQKEILSAAQRIKLLESENKLLETEAVQLRQVLML
jgi:hypothetical protein